jgi:hypothetical protein
MSVEVTLEGKERGHRPRSLQGADRVPLPAEPGESTRFDTEYVRNGTCDIFMFVAPLEGRR